MTIFMNIFNVYLLLFCLYTILIYLFNRDDPLTSYRFTDQLIKFCVPLKLRDRLVPTHRCAIKEGSKINNHDWVKTVRADCRITFKLYPIRL